MKVLMRWIALVVGLCGLAFLGTQVFMWVRDILDTYNAAETTQTFSAAVITLIFLYAFLIAIPFMPGIELGVALLVMQGAAVAPLVYLATVFGLMTAYLLGHLMPLPWLARLFKGLGLKRAANLVQTITEQTLEERLERQRQMLPVALAKLTVDYRYVTLAILVNVPGTFAIGGGGGILLAAGLSHAFRPLGILLTLMIATLPVPLFVWVLGTSIL